MGAAWGSLSHAWLCFSGCCQTCQAQGRSTGGLPRRSGAGNCTTPRFFLFPSLLWLLLGVLGRTQLLGTRCEQGPQVCLCLLSEVSRTNLEPTAPFSRCSEHFVCSLSPPPFCLHPPAAAELWDASLRAAGRSHSRNHSWNYSRNYRRN